MNLREVRTLNSVRRDTLEARRKLRTMLEYPTVEQEDRELLERELRALALVSGAMAGILRRHGQEVIVQAAELLPDEDLLVDIVQEHRQ